MKRQHLLLLALPLLLAVTMLRANEENQAPDFTLVDAKGVEHSLASYRGKYVVLEWLNHGCPFVRKHYSGNMQKLQKEWGEKGVVWLSIVSSAPGKQGHMSAEEHVAMAKEKGSNATAILLDESGDVGRLYEAKTTPHMFVISPEGRILYRGAIDDKPTADVDDIATATNLVSQALTEAMADQPVSVAARQPYGCSVKY